ncbi:hypothetical protein UFOVP116_376 [uncultured Caudovirales phage]|uniref:Uncharacterized protein n=1 Tax=uncultured Caudovirales phage TaxID=2100421 RepID=A0A6J5LAG4_9CAUD|nr:hypothetical protein UFOVP116_376 [uncultured Caudovirales phage]
MKINNNPFEAIEDYHKALQEPEPATIEELISPHYGEEDEYIRKLEQAQAMMRILGTA